MPRPAVRGDAWRVSPQQIDPLSWFTRPLVPLAFAALALVMGLGTVAATWRLTDRPGFELAGIALVVTACIVVQVRTRPMRPSFGAREAVLPLALAVAGLVASTVAAAGSTALVQHSWAPIGVGLVVATLGPFSTVRQTVVHGALLTVATAVCASTAYAGDGRDRVWPPLSTAVIAGGVVAVATVATAAFSFAVVSTTLRMLGAARPDSSALRDEAADRVERRTLARLGNRVAPFLERVATAGEVTDADRALAGQLARRLRSDLVLQANRTWLDSVALGGRIHVVDPEGRADRMTTVQRTALRGLLVGIVDHPAAAVGSLLVELRGDDDGATAVALSLDFALPEGNRATMLAPYYLTLQSTVDSLTWDPSRDLLRFQLPARGPDE
jgi:hypothetical protein